MKLEARYSFVGGMFIVFILILLTFVKSAYGLIDYDPTYTNLVDRYILARLKRLGTEPHWASQEELMRRMSLDLNGALPTNQDATNLAAATASEMANYFMNKPEYRAMSQVIWADMLAFSNDQMFSTDTQIDTLNDLVGMLHDGDIMFNDFLKQVIVDPAFLSRFVSSADRNTAAFNIFLGYETVTPYDFEFSNMFNGYQLTDAPQREYTWTGVCDNPVTPTVETCVANIWGMTGENSTDAGMMLTSLPAFAEHGAGLVWHRYVGSDIDVAIPELSIALGEEFAASSFDLRAITLLIITSAAYIQSNTYRDTDRVL